MANGRISNRMPVERGEGRGLKRVQPLLLWKLDEWWTDKITVSRGHNHNSLARKCLVLKNMTKMPLQIACLEGYNTIQNTPLFWRPATLIYWYFLTTPTDFRCISDPCHCHHSPTWHTKTYLRFPVVTHYHYLVNHCSWSTGLCARWQTIIFSFLSVW